MEAETWVNNPSNQDPVDYSKVDPKIRNIIKLLNNFGYKTWNSCQGGGDPKKHGMDHSELGYISFEPKEGLIEFLAGYLMQVEGRLEFMKSNSGMRIIMRLPLSKDRSLDAKWSIFYGYLIEHIRASSIYDNPCRFHCDE